MDAIQLTKIRPMILNSPLDQWSYPEMDRLFHRLIQLKLDGYGANYPRGVLPIDTTDFYASHLILGFDDDFGFRPLMSGKTTLLSRTEFHQHTFPALSLVEQAGSAEHSRVVRLEIESALRGKSDLAYFGSWTVDPIVRQDPNLRSFLRDIFPGMYVNFHRYLGVQRIFLGGTLRFKTERLFEKLGHVPLAYNGNVLENIQVRHLFQENVQVMYLTKFSEFAEKESERMRFLWKHCEFIGEINKKHSVA